jgi:hypothetical protein
MAERAEVWREERPLLAAVLLFQQSYFFPTYPFFSLDLGPACSTVPPVVNRSAMRRYGYPDTTKETLPWMIRCFPRST